METGLSGLMPSAGFIGTGRQTTSIASTHSLPSTFHREARFDERKHGAIERCRLPHDGWRSNYSNICEQNCTRGRSATAREARWKQGQVNRAQHVESKPRNTAHCAPMPPPVTQREVVRSDCEGSASDQRLNCTHAGSVGNPLQAYPLSKKQSIRARPREARIAARLPFAGPANRGRHGGGGRGKLLGRKST